MKHHLFSLGIFLIIILFVYRSLAFNLTSNLPDWLDYALVNWLIFQSVDKLTNFNFNNFFDTNAFYPNRLTLFFTDTLLPQAIMATPFYLVSKNYILSFNLSFFTIFILNFFSAYLFWKHIFKGYLIGILGGLLVFFSPFFHLERSHFQMLFYWPFFLTFYYLFKSESNPKLRYILLAAIFYAIQFLASVYIFIFLSFAISIYFIIRLLTSSNKKFILKAILFILTIFILIDGIFIKGYLDMKENYNFKRDFKEYITYSANISDYIFTNRINSLLHLSQPLNIWNSIDKNTLWGSAQFPGFLVFILGLIGLFKINRNKQRSEIILGFNKERFFFFSLLIIGFLFSLGPRIIFNNNYSHIPAPYAIFLKTIPLLESIRAVCRWSFLFYIGFIYFALVPINYLQKKYQPYLILAVFIFLLVIEYVPLNISTHKEEIMNENYALIGVLCSVQKQALLEIPVTHLNVYPGIGEGVNYISKVEFSSLYHKCYLVNGYSGYDLPELFELNNNLYQDILFMDSKKFIVDAKNAHADIVKFNNSSLPLELQLKLPLFLKKLSIEKNIEIINDQVYQIN